MRPTLRQLQYLVAIADTGRFGDAARRCNVSQPSLSNQIADMEAELGLDLVERGRRGAVLTPAGYEIVQRARLILRDVEDLKAFAASGSGQLTGRIRLGVLPTIGAYLLPAVSRRLHARYPSLRLGITELSTVELERQLQEGQLDTIISTPADHHEVEYEILFRESLWICVAPDDTLAMSEGDVSLSALRGRPLLTLGHGHRLALIVQAVATAAEAYVSSDYRGTSLDAIRQMTETGAGVGVIPSIYALTQARRDPTLIIRRIDSELARRDIALVWRRSAPFAGRLRPLAAELRREAQAVLKTADEA